MSDFKFVNTNYTLGNGCLESLANYKDGRIALVVDSRVLKALGLEDRLYNNILKGCNYRVICDMPKEPTMELLEKPIEAIKEFEPKYIIAVGGGSVIDSAKILWLFYELPDYTWEQALVPYAVAKFPGKAKLIAVPTTSGTGSETTHAAVVKDYDKRKRLVLTPEIMPREAILDFDLLLSLTPNIIAFSGTDALAHAIEAATAKVASPFVRMISVCAAVDILELLKKSFGGDLEARAGIHIAASLAGAGINNSITGLAHGMDFAGGDFNLPHGLVTGMLLPYTMEFLMPNPVYGKIADRLGIQGNNEEKQRKLIDRIFELNKSIGMPMSFREAGVSEEAYMSKLDSYIEMAKVDANVNLAAKTPDSIELRKMFTTMYYGK